MCGAPSTSGKFHVVCNAIMKIFTSLLLLFSTEFSLHSLNLKTAIIEIEDKKLNAILAPMIHYEWYPDKPEPKITRADRRAFTKKMKTGPTPLKEGFEEGTMLLTDDGKYFEYSRPTSTDTYERQFVLFEKATGESILGVTLSNSAREPATWYTDIYFLCKVSGGWQDCTKQVLPPFSLEGFLKPGAVMRDETKTYGYLKYLLSKKGENIEIRIVESRLPTPAVPPGAKPQPKNNELDKFMATSFKLKWSPRHLKYEFVP